MPKTKTPKKPTRDMFPEGDKGEASFKEMESVWEKTYGEKKATADVKRVPGKSTMPYREDIPEIEETAGSNTEKAKSLQKEAIAVQKEVEVKPIGETEIKLTRKEQLKKLKEIRKANAAKKVAEAKAKKDKKKKN